MTHKKNKKPWIQIRLKEKNHKKFFLNLKKKISLISVLGNLVFLIFYASYNTACSSSHKKSLRNPNSDSSKLSTYDPCPIKGHSIYWMTQYCYKRGNTNNKLNKKFRSCIMNLRNETKNLSECKIRFALKTKNCQHSIDLDYIDEDLKTCMDNKEHDKKWGAL